MTWLDSLTPTNLLEVKAKFFADFSYNPQFIYSKGYSPEDLIKYGLPQKKYADLARTILDTTFFGRNEADLRMNEGPALSEQEVNNRITTFLKMHDLHNRFEIVWSHAFVSRATITENQLKLRANAEFREQSLIGMIYHELGTHALRRINYEAQPWFKKKKKFGLNHSYLKTEEGLATLHSLIPHYYKSAHRSALRYLAVDFAQKHSFAEVWHFLTKYIDDPETRWAVTFRQKRGLEDTSQGGGLTKDLVYFQGAVEVWGWLAQHDFDITQLYFGKVAYEDIELAVSLNPDFKPVLPSFFTLDHKKYAKNLMEIGTENNFESVLSL
jgi:hypothetical protein